MNILSTYKKLILNIVVLLGLCFCGSNIASAATWYVRDGGGTAAQCTGKSNAVYPGSGTSQSCAFASPMIALGYCDGNESVTDTMPCAVAGHVASGDTLYIDGDSDVNPGQQAQYEIGYDDSGAGLTPGCTLAGSWACWMANVPAGISTSQPTSIIGTGTHKPQLWGAGRTQQVIWADNNYITLQSLEITDHLACAYNNPGSLCDYSTAPYGQWGVDGLYIGGTGLILTDVYAHGMGRYGMATDNIGNATFTRLWVIGNGYAGITVGNDGATSVSGTLTFNQPIIEWNGCVEAHPLTGGIDTPSNYKNCFGQQSQGYGDGLAFGASGNENAGNWTVIGPGSISFNTQDGLDTVHGVGNGTIQVDKMRFEGNAGEQVKINALNEYLTNSLVISDCGWWYGAPQSLSSGMQMGDTCRAGGDATLFNVTNNSVAVIYNNTILSNGGVALESKDLNSTGCNSSTALHAYNNIILGGYTWDDDTAFNSSGGNSQSAYIYNDGNDGNGAGTCGNLKWDENYNIVSNTKNNNGLCVGSHDKCGTAPGFASGTFPMGTAGGAANTFYQGNIGETLLALSSSSPAIASGESGLTYWNNGNDYYNVARTNPPSVGGLESKSCAVNGYGCFYNSDCCAGTCSLFFCGAAASQPVVSITSPSNGSSISSGSNITISATASETNGTITNIAIYNGSTLLGQGSSSPYTYVATDVPAATYTLTAKATDAKGISTTSSPVTVTVKNASVLPSLPVVTITSSGSSYTAGSNVTITTTASETNGTIANIAIYNTSGILLGSSNTSPYSYVDKNLLAGTYIFYAVATDTNGVSTTSILVTVTVTGTAAATAAAPSITSQPVSETVTAPATATFTVTATGTPAPTYQWLQNVNGGGFLNISGATSASYTTPATTTANSGTQYKCVASNASGNAASNVVTLTVNSAPSAAPSITTQPASKTVTAPATATFTVTATGTPAPTYQWLQNVNGGGFLNISGATSASYTTPATTTANSGTQYKCVASNASGNAASNVVTLTVNSTPSAAPSITTQPASKTVTAPATATFTVTATGTPAPTYQWLQNVNGGGFLNITGATSASYTTPATTTANSGTQYKCVVSNASGNAASSVVTLTVNSASPVVTMTSPSNGSSVTMGSNITFTATASEAGGTISQVMFFFNGTQLATGTANGNSYSYTVNVANVSTGAYALTAVATDAKGVSTTSSPVTISVVAASVAPSITSQPVSETVTAPATATFTVTATGTPSPTYQWLQSVNGGGFLNISGATSASYTTPATTAADSGTQYKCVVSNASGNAASSVVTLTVNNSKIVLF